MSTKTKTTEKKEKITNYTLEISTMFEMMIVNNAFKKLLV